MKTLLPFIVYAGLFYLMMRFGCGAHMAHGHGGHSHDVPKTDSPEASGEDPVCEMRVPAGQGYTKDHRGRTIRFCSRNCLDKFEAAPQRYL